LIKLTRPIKFSQTIQPVCLPVQNETIPVGANGNVAGWGALDRGAEGPKALNQVVVPVLPNEYCQQVIEKFFVPSAMFCAGFEQGQKDSCQGDSGGPYFIEGPRGYTLHGVVSWGLGCAKANSPGVYTRVPIFVDWIQSEIKNLSTVKP